MEFEETEGPGSMVLAQDYVTLTSGRTADVVFIYGTPNMFKHMVPKSVYTVEAEMGVEFDMLYLAVKPKSDEEAVLAAAIRRDTFEMLKGMGIPVVPTDVVKAAIAAQEAAQKAISEST